MASPQPADADDEDDALAYDESEDEADAPAQPAAVEGHRAAILVTGAVPAATTAGPRP